MAPIVVDTGPLVAYFSRGDHDHARIASWFERESRKVRLLSAEAVITESTHLLSGNVEVQTAFVEWAGSMLEILPLPRAAYAEIARRMRGYANVPMDFADAAVLWLYRATPGSRVLTLDGRGFGVYRLPDEPRRGPAVVPLPERSSRRARAR